MVTYLALGIFSETRSSAGVSVGVNVSMKDTSRDHSDQIDSETSSRST